MVDLETNRFFLKEIAPEDIENIYRGLSDPRVTQYYAVHFDSLEATREQMSWYEALKKNDTGLWWGIYEKGSGEFCGAGGYNDLDRKHRKAEIGFWLLPRFWGHGIMQEVMPQVLTLGFENLDLNRVEGFVDSRNKACKTAMKKLKFCYEGRLRQAEIENGEFVDVDIYSFLKKDRLQ